MHVVLEIAWKIIAERRIELEVASVGELQGDQSKDRLAEGRCVEDGVLGDRDRFAGKPDAVAFVPGEFALSDRGDGSAGDMRCLHQVR